MKNLILEYTGPVDPEGGIELQKRCRFVVALETVDGIIKGNQYELIDIDDSGLYYYIVDETGEATAYWHSVLDSEAEHRRNDGLHRGDTDVGG